MLYTLSVSFWFLQNDDLIIILRGSIYAYISAFCKFDSLKQISLCCFDALLLTFYFFFELSTSSFVCTYGTLRNEDGDAEDDGKEQ